MNPRKSPNCTTIRTNAKTIPVRVTINRTLSWRRFRLAKIPMVSLSLVRSCLAAPLTSGGLLTSLTTQQKKLNFSLQTVHHGIDRKVDHFFFVSPWKAPVHD